MLCDTGDFAGARIALNDLKSSGSLERTLQLRSVQILRAEGNLAEALQEIESYIKEYRVTAEALKQRGILYLDLGDAKAAIRDLTKSLEEDDFDKDAHIKLAQAYLKTGQKELATPHQERSRQLSEATSRIVEVTRRLEREPANQELNQEVEGLYKIIGRRAPARQQ